MILELIKTGDFKGAYELLKAKESVEDYAKEYNNARDIRDSQVGKREDKSTKDKVIPVNKIPIPFHRKIVKSAMVFLFGSAVKLLQLNKEEGSKTKLAEAFSSIKTLWDEVRMDSLLLKFCESVKSETEAAIVFFPVQKEGGSFISKLARLLKLSNGIVIKARLLNNKSGKLFPYFDEYGDMLAFGWEFTKNENSKDVKYLYLFTAEKTFLLRENGNDWAAVEKYPQENKFKKIPAVYMSQEMPEWFYVQGIIDRYEMSYSKFCDTNDYFASPKYKAKGKINQSVADSKVVELEIKETSDGKIIYGDLDVIGWEHAPESVKLEFETGKDLIYGLSDTANFSAESMKGVGNVANYAMELMFYGAILKAKEDQGDYKIAISRIVNIMKAGIGNILSPNLSSVMDELQLDVEFTSVLPKNIKETIEVLTEATAGEPVMSQKTAMEHNPMVEDVEAEMEQIKVESSQKMGETVEP